MNNEFKIIENIRRIWCSRCEVEVLLSECQLLELLEFDSINPTCNDCRTPLKISRINGKYFIREA